MVSVSSLWGYLYKFCGEDDFVIGVYGTLLVTNVMFVAVNVFYAIVDLTGRPAWMYQYKVQDDVKVNADMYMKAAKRVSLNMIFGTMPMTVVAYYVSKWLGAPCGYEGIPSLFTAIWQLTCILLIEEFGFYYSHRLFHHPLLYKRCHKIHHEFTAPVGIVSLYSHPVEHLISNILPLMMGPVITRAHLSLVWLWYAMAILNTTNSHSGYHLPFLVSPEAHDYHHLKFTNNFGVLGILDYLHGTNTEFKKSIEGKRHRVVYQLTPAKQVYTELCATEDFVTNTKVD